MVFHALQKGSVAHEIASAIGDTKQYVPPSDAIYAEYFFKIYAQLSVISCYPTHYLKHSLLEYIDDGNDRLAMKTIFPLWAKVQISNRPRRRDGDAALNQPTQTALLEGLLV